jgi:hypothetical protein
VHGVPQFLFAAEVAKVAFRRLDTHVREQELIFVEFATRHVGQTAHVRRKSCEAGVSMPRRSRTSQSATQKDCRTRRGLVESGTPGIPNRHATEGCKAPGLSLVTIDVAWPASVTERPAA